MQAVPFAGSYWVIPDRFLAGRYPGDFVQDAAEKRLTSLLDTGIRTFIDLTDEDEIHEDAKPAPPYRPLLRQLAENRRIETTYIRCPMEDQGVPSIWTVRYVLDVMDRSLEDENPVYVHCWAGRGRTGIMVGCYLKRHGMATDKDVLARIAELRRFLPDRDECSPITSQQVRMVANWKRGA